MTTPPPADRPMDFTYRAILAITLAAIAAGAMPMGLARTRPAFAAPAPANAAPAPAKPADGLPAVSPRPQTGPNVVLIFADDMGYGDVGCYAPTVCRTPNLDKLAAGGVRFTNFYVAQAVCSASRAALMTGCYPNRVGVFGALFPHSTSALSHAETTVAEVLASRGYATGCFGKWHLGHTPLTLPTAHGFEVYFGLPYSNDMRPPTRPNTPAKADEAAAGKAVKAPAKKSGPPPYPPLPLIEGTTVIETDPDQRNLTNRYTQKAIAFIEDSHRRGRPFFAYVPYTMPHVPLYVSDQHHGHTGAGLYADVIAEIDTGVGAIIAALDRLSLTENTLVIFTSDNGPWLRYGDHGGSAGGLREGKSTTFEGGVRVPFIAAWPGRIPAGAVVAEPAMTIDLLPTLAKLTGATGAVSTDRVIDGRDIGDLLMAKPGATSPHQALLFWWGRELQAVRAGRWKLHLPHKYNHSDPAQRGRGGKSGAMEVRSMPLSLFDLEADPGETTNLADRHPEVVARLMAAAEAAREDLGDSLTDAKGSGARPAMPISDAPPPAP